MLHDKLGREIHDLRISVTDRCNFSCVYCKSADPKNYFPHRDLLTWEEFLRLSRVLVGMGIRKIRVTGGEPLLREGVVDFIARLREIEGLDGRGGDHQRIPAAGDGAGARRCRGSARHRQPGFNEPGKVHQDHADAALLRKSDGRH